MRSKLYRLVFPDGFRSHLTAGLLAFFYPFACLSWVVLVAWILVDGYAGPLLLASMGAAAVLMFSAPHSPMATYRAFLLGNLLSAVIGVTCFQILGDGVLVGPFAVALAIAFMHLLKCAHPPRGATALVAVIGGSSIHALGYGYVLAPVALNIFPFAAVVWLHRKRLSSAESRQDTRKRLQSILEVKTDALDTGPSEADIRTVLQRLGMELDVSSDKLQELLHAISQETQKRQLGDRTCGELMRTDVQTVAYGDSILQAWKLMNQDRRSYVIVEDTLGRVAGQIRLERLIQQVDVHRNDPELVNKITKRLQPTGQLEVQVPEEAGQFVEPIHKASTDDRCASLINEAITVAAIVDSKGRLLGVYEAPQL